LWGKLGKKTATPPKNALRAGGGKKDTRGTISPDANYKAPGTGAKGKKTVLENLKPTKTRGTQNGPSTRGNMRNGPTPPARPGTPKAKIARQKKKKKKKKQPLPPGESRRKDRGRHEKKRETAPGNNTKTKGKKQIKSAQTRPSDSVGKTRRRQKNCQPKK